METDELKRAFGQRVQSLREQAGLTQERLADQIGRSVDTISNIERGANSTRVETAARIAEALGVALPELFEFNVEPEPGRQRRREIAELLRRLGDLDDRQFRLLLSLLATGLSLSETTQ
jgi:transcriptional regulator with XRE-family HTH domain